MRRKSPVVSPAIGIEFGQNARQIGGVGDNHDIGVIFRGAADHGGAANVDILNAFVEAGTLRDGLLEGIEVDDEQIDRLDPMRIHRGLMFGIVADREQPAMHFRMQCLYPAVHHLGKAGEFGHVFDRKPGCGQRPPCAARRDEVDTARRQRLGEIDQPGLVGDG